MGITEAIGACVEGRLYEGLEVNLVSLISLMHFIKIYESGFSCMQDIESHVLCLRPPVHRAALLMADFAS